MLTHKVPTHLNTQDRVLFGLTIAEILGGMGIMSVSYGFFNMLPLPSTFVRLLIVLPCSLMALASIFVKPQGRRLIICLWDIALYHRLPKSYSGLRTQAIEARTGRRSSATRPDGVGPLPPSRSAPHLPSMALQFNTAKTWVSDSWQNLQPGLTSATSNVRSLLTPKLPPIALPSIGRRERPEPPPQGGAGDSAPRQPRTRLATIGIVVAITVLLSLLTITVYADGPLGGDGWDMGYIEFLRPDPVPGRRIFVEHFSAMAGSADISLRAATDLRLLATVSNPEVGPDLTWSQALDLRQGEAWKVSMPVEGAAPSFDFHWEDRRGQRGTVTLAGQRSPYPLPTIETEYCRFSITHLGWTTGSVQGRVQSECEESGAAIDETPTHTGAISQTVTDVVIRDQVITHAGEYKIKTNPETSQITEAFSATQDTEFNIPIQAGPSLQRIVLEIDLSTSFKAIPPKARRHSLVESWVQTQDERVCLDCGCATVTLTHRHPEYIRPGGLVDQSPLAPEERTQTKLTTSIYADSPYQSLALPESSFLRSLWDPRP